VVPISVMVLRRTAPELHRPLRVPGLPVLAPMAFVLATLMLFWARWPHTAKSCCCWILPLRCICTIKPRAIGATSGASCALLVAVGLSHQPSRFYRGPAARKFEGHDYISLRLGPAVCRIGVARLLFLGVRSGWRTPAVIAVEKNAAEMAAVKS